MRDSQPSLTVIPGGVPPDGQPGAEEARADHRQRVEQLFKAYGDALLGYLTRLLRDPQDAEDLRHETYVRLLKAKQLEPLECRARAYMFKIATNLVRDRFRRAAVRGQQLPADDCDLVSEDPQPDRIADWNQGMQIIKQTLLDLKPRTRQVFLLHVTEHLSYREIAKRLGVNKKTVERDMRLALELCQDRLKVWQRT